MPWFEPFRELREIYLNLAGGDQPYATRLRILRQALAPTGDRGGSYYEDEDDDGQDRFAAVDRRWRLMNETHDGRQTIRHVSVGPGFAAPRRMPQTAYSRMLNRSIAQRQQPSD